MKREDIKDFFKKLYETDWSEKKILLEQEEDEEGEDLFGDEEDTEDEDEDEGEGDAEEEDSEEEESNEKEKVKIEPGDEARFGKQFDLALDSILADYEMNALKSAQINKDSADFYKLENFSNKNLSNLLFEQEDMVSEVDFDVDLFSEEVSRLIRNYDTLMDMESIIFNKAKEYLIIKYGKDVADAFSENLRKRYGLSFDEEIQDTEDIEDIAPLAVGSGGGEGA